MIYCGTEMKEVIIVHPDDDVNKMAWVILTKAAHDNIFSVELVFDEDFSVEWNFWLEGGTNYEQVKLCIFDTMESVDDMAELCECLDGLFTECFSEILIEESCEDCDKKDGCEEYFSRMN